MKQQGLEQSTCIQKSRFLTGLGARFGMTSSLDFVLFCVDVSHSRDQHERNGGALETAASLPTSRKRREKSGPLILGASGEIRSEGLAGSRFTRWGQAFLQSFHDSLWVARLWNAEIGFRLVGRLGRIVFRNQDDYSMIAAIPPEEID